MKLRRVVTGHDANAKAVVMIDEIIDSPRVGRPGAFVAPIWITEGFPVDNDDHEDTSKRKAATIVPNGTAFRVIEFKPGVRARNHRTSSIDYAIVMSGEIDMEMDGTLLHLNAGDVLVQRGTIHNWVNNGTESCVIAFVLIDAKPVTAGGKRLESEG
jgi:quercetin dioxygenase-like cupin family protein